MQAKLKALLAEHGRVAVILYFTLFFLTWGGFALAISTGFQPEGAAAGAGVTTASYIATKLTQPLRVGVTLAVTPFATRLWQRVRGVKPANPAEVLPQAGVDPGQSP
ncbi:MAG: hypothetical protein EXR69_06480 [Myxococcales bacterium]|nr:hypothetical protein [Myxococcales bacterium]